jgi:pimeloyl-ACP methyl ester carboxylesterase
VTADPQVRQVDGAPVRYERWGGGTPEVVLVHGFAGHGGWWAPVAQRIAATVPVMSVELTGHGDSGRREQYSMTQWADELATAIRTEVDPDRPALLVGHSLGGIVGALALPQVPDRISGLVLVDTVLRAPRQPPENANRPSASRRRSYETLDDAVAHFRLMPQEPVADTAALTTLARRGAHRVADGWQWKLDPAVFRGFGPLDQDAAIAALTVPVTVVRGERSGLVDPEVGQVASEILGRPVPQIDIPGAYHHLMIDHPDEVARIVDRLLDRSRAA